MHGYVYLIYDKGNDSYKIGVTRSKNSKRLKQLQTGNSSELDLIYLYETRWPFRLETMLHNYYINNRISGEWFKIDNISEYKKKCDELNHLIELLKDNPFFNKNLR